MTAPGFGFEPTPEQLAIVEAGERGDSFVTEAGAGTAKSSTILLTAKRLVEAHGMDRMLYLVFNRSASEKAKRQVTALGLGDSLSVHTAHNLAWSAVGYRYRDRVSGDGHILLAGALEERDAFSRFAPKDPFAFGVAVIDLLSRYCASKDKEIGVEHLPPALSDEEEIDPERLLEAARDIWPQMVDTGNSLPLFHDVYLKLYALSEVPLRFKVVFFDEAQDASACMFAITERQRKLQRAYFGDDNQSIYAFRHAINVLNLLELPRYSLTHSFRFGPNIAEYVNRLLDLKGSKLRVVGAAAEPGRVTMQGSLMHADVLVARTNVGMFEAALAAIARPEIKGITFPGFKNHTELLLASYELYSGRAVKEGKLKGFRTWGELVTASRSEQASMLAPYVRLVTEHKDQIPDLVRRLEEQQRSPSKGGLRLSTIHGLKGDEENVVRFVSDFQSPVRDGEIDVEESNLWYVALTRARKVLDLGGAATVITEVLGEPTMAQMAAAGDSELTLGIQTVLSDARSAPAPSPTAAAAESPSPAHAVADTHAAAAPSAAPAAEAEPVPEPAPTRSVKSAAAMVLDALPDAVPESNATPPARAAAAPIPRSAAAARPRKPKPASVPTPLYVPMRDRYRAARAGARHTDAGWYAPIGTDLNGCEAWMVRSGQGAMPAVRVFGHPRLAPTGEGQWLVGRSWVESVGSYAAMRSRRALGRLQDGKCAVCGERTALEAHVRIEYGQNLIATMRDLLGLCQMCHAAQHIERGGDLRALARHLMRVNKENEETSLLRLRLAKDELERRDGNWYLLEIGEGFPPALHSAQVRGLDSPWARARDAAARFIQAPRQQFLRWFVAGAAQTE